MEWARYEMRRAPSTIARYREALNWVIRDVGDLPVEQLTMGHILSLRRKMDQRGCREARIAAVLNALRSFLRFCREVLRVAGLDPRHVRVPRIPRRDVVYLTKEEVDRFVKAIIGPGERWDAYTGEAEHSDRPIVNAPIGDRDRSGATLAGRSAVELPLPSP